MAAILSQPQCVSQDAWCNMTLIDHDELCCVKQTTQLTCPGCKRKMFLTPGWCQNPRQDCSKVCWDRWGAKNKQRKAIAIRCCHTGNKQKAKKKVLWFDTQKCCEILKDLVVGNFVKLYLISENELQITDKILNWLWPNDTCQWLSARKTYLHC